MENQNEYLNEEKYKKAEKKVKKAGTILLVIGGLMVVAAIVIFIVFIAVLNKPMSAALGGPLLVFGFAFLGFGGQAKFIGHARDINAYMAQQQIPIAQEGLEKMAPSVGKAGSTIAKEMAPAYGDIAKEISKGIKEGIKETGSTVYCKYCGSQIDSDSIFCKKCGKKI